MVLRPHSLTHAVRRTRNLANCLWAWRILHVTGGGQGDKTLEPSTKGNECHSPSSILSAPQARPKGAADPTRWRGGDGRGHHTNLWLTSERLGWWWRLFPRIVLHSLWSFRSETRLRDEQRDGHHFQHFSSFILVSHGKRKEMLKVILYYIIITVGPEPRAASVGSHDGRKWVIWY